MNKDNRCSIPFTGYAHLILDKNTISPCCKIRQSPIITDNLLTDDTIAVRQAIKDNTKHPLCSECWMVEANGGPSYRVRNSEHFLRKFDWDNIDIQTPHKKVILVFSNKCQMMCAYCGPLFSSMWEKKLNTIPVIQQVNDINLINNLLLTNSFSDISISGGEPMLDDACVDYLQKLEFDPTRTISMVTNLSYGPSVFNNLLSIIDRHPTLYMMCSIDAVGQNVTRKYLNWDLWNNNFRKLVDNLQSRIKKFPRITLTTKSTVGILNYKDVQQVIEYVLDFRLNGAKNVTFDLNPLSDTTVTSLSSGIVDKSIKIHLEEKYLKVLSKKEQMLIEKTNELIQKSIFDKSLADVSEGHIKKYVD